jgi:hypothetical protein
VAIAAGALVAAPAPASTRQTPTVRQSRHLWATVNVCDTLSHPDSIGIRGSMPGSGRAAERMYMRFTVQYFRADQQQWHNIGRGGESGFVSVGSARFKARQAGRLFVFAPPAGGSWNMRGVVTFEWRVGARVVRRERERTTAGHRSAAGADPAGYSSDSCLIS